MNWQPETWLGFYRAAKQKNMENQEKFETSIDYFYRIVKNNAINLGRTIETYCSASKMYENEIKEAKKEGWKKGYQDAIRINNKQIAKTYRAIAIIFSVFSAIILVKLIYILLSHI
jgi:hypothetical protein